MVSLIAVGLYDFLSAFCNLDFYAVISLFDIVRRCSLLCFGDGHFFTLLYCSCGGGPETSQPFPPYLYYTISF